MKDKKSFILYTDIKHTVAHLTDEQAGALFKHILAYVTDEDPQSDNPFVNLAFEPIKQSLKRDLKKFESIKAKRSEAGRKGGKQSQANQADAKQSQAKGSKAKQSQANQAVSVSDSDSVSDSVSVKVKEDVSGLEDRIEAFRLSLIPYVSKYGKETIRKFFQYWTEPNKSRTKFKQEMQKTWSTSHRLSTWASNNFDKSEVRTTKATTF